MDVIRVRLGHIPSLRTYLSISYTRAWAIFTDCARRSSVELRPKGARVIANGTALESICRW